MPRTKADISNSAIRIFLQEVGRLYDEVRELPRYRGTPAQKQEILSFFGGKCCYCGVDISLKDMNQDHLIPMNRQALGLHSWGNVVPSCGSCNSRKQHKGWELYLSVCSSDEPDLEASRKVKLLQFMDHYGYEPNVELASVAGNLYEDVGEVAMTLINLRFKQAEALLKIIHTME
jgi:hypothetical protein